MGNDLSPATMRALLERRGVVKQLKDEKGVTTSVIALIVVNRSLMRKIRRSKITIGQSLIEFRQSRRSNRRRQDYFVWNN